jgi:adenosylcobinamide kinase/adenosylcobinamide-phosphate guanylyltransferase
MLTLVIGGARCGKTQFAQSLCQAGQRVCYIATARADDDEMCARIARHRRHRPAQWLTIEEPLQIAHAAERMSGCDFLLLDCLTIWLSNFSWEHRELAQEQGEDALADAAKSELAKLFAAAPSSHLVIVTNEVGYGLVPDTPVGRLFRDLQGWLNQDAARAADFVYHVVAGIPIAIKRPEGSGGKP